MLADTSLFKSQVPAVRYTLACSSMALAIAISYAVRPVVGEFSACLACTTAIAFSAWYCGLGPSVAASAMALAGLKYWFLPGNSFFYISGKQAVVLTAFAIAAALIIAMGESRRRDNETLHLKRTDLEEQVLQRTADLNAANEDLRHLTARLLQLQDEERRRIARELHDSIGQMMVALSLNLNTVGAEIARLTQTASVIADSAALVDQVNKEVRTISYLLHPPLLDEAGLASALRWYVDGFSQRSKIQVVLEIPEDFGRLSQEAEIAIFRTVQEGLTNIHRHSGSDSAKVVVSRKNDEVRLMVEDRGAGISAEKLAEVTAGVPGVGIGGMRERLRQLGGSLEIKSNAAGTKVHAIMPDMMSSRIAA